MSLFKKRSVQLLTFLCLLSSLVYVFLPDSSERIKQKIGANLASKNYKAMYRQLANMQESQVALDDIEAIARKHDSESLKTAVSATRKMPELKDAITPSQFLQLAFFIESNYDQLFKEKRTYLDKHQSGLTHTLECIQKDNRIFIVLEGPGAKIGKGKKKIVTKAVMYDPKGSKIVARLEQSVRMKREVHVTKEMQNKPGIFEVYGFSKHIENGKRYTTIYSKLYNSGSLYNALKSTQFTFDEKLKMAASILQGLARLHDKKLVHRDLGTKNYLVDIQILPDGSRHIECVIADLGRTNYTKHVAGSKPQGNTSYTAPEALFRNRMKGKDYLQADVYAVGLVLYWIYYGQRASWQDSKYVKERHLPIQQRYETLVSRLENETSEKRTLLQQKASLNQAEAFEALILNMLETVPENRLTSKQLCEKMQSITKSCG